MEVETLLKTGESILKDTPKKDNAVQMMLKAFRTKIELIKANKKLVSKTRY